MTLCLGRRSDSAASPAARSLAASRSRHVKCPPSAALAPFVDYYWVTRWDRTGQPSRDASALLDPCVHLQIIGGQAYVLGVLRGTLRMRIEGVGCVVGVKFRPGGFYPLVRQPVAQWTDRAVPAEAVFKRADESLSSWSREAWGEVATCLGDDAAHAAVITTHLDAFLETRNPQRDEIAEDVAALVALIAEREAVRRVGDLVRESGRSERTLHRLFGRYLGVSPAWMIRRYRLRAAAERLEVCDPAEVRAVAWEFGYADQSHLIRDFRATIGVTPGAYVRAGLQVPGLGG